mmetsp:Transcript_16475/g.24198  ORF Transcript_16475/g.24198 Transcript_16475/m.24198 type:complete len:236 (-) Transcript_16475:737-1444(-)
MHLLHEALLDLLEVKYIAHLFLQSKGNNVICLLIRVRPEHLQGGLHRVSKGHLELELLWLLLEDSALHLLAGPFKTLQQRIRRLGGVEHGGGLVHVGGQEGGSNGPMGVGGKGVHPPAVPPVGLLGLFGASGGPLALLLPVHPVLAVHHLLLQLRPSQNRSAHPRVRFHALNGRSIVGGGSENRVQEGLSFWWKVRSSSQVGLPESLMPPVLNFIEPPVLRERNLERWVPCHHNK